jgi:hypothetical protein
MVQKRNDEERAAMQATARRESDVDARRRRLIAYRKVCILLID